MHDQLITQICLENFQKKPDQISLLNSLSNYVYKIEIEQKNFVLKLANKNFKNFLKINRDLEEKIVKNSDYF